MTEAPAKISSRRIDFASSMVAAALAAVTYHVFFGMASKPPYDALMLYEFRGPRFVPILSNMDRCEELGEVIHARTGKVSVKVPDNGEMFDLPPGENLNVEKVYCIPLQREERK